MKKYLLAILLVLICNLAVNATVKGDVNGDGKVTSVDITAIYNYLIYGDSTYLATSDVNGDGTISSVDITVIYNILLGIETHDYVDLGLPSGTLWATMNIGADNPEDYGDYFAWGETESKNRYHQDNYKWGNGSSNMPKLTKYCTISSYGNNGFVDNITELELEDDAAYVNWGPKWRIPSREQIEELIANCTTQISHRNGVRGRLFTSNINGASLFFPIAGYFYITSLYHAGSFGYYWSRTLYTNKPTYAHLLYFDAGVKSGNNARIYGRSIRPVRVAQN